MPVDDSFCCVLSLCDILEIKISCHVLDYWDSILFQNGRLLIDLFDVIMISN